MWNSTYSSRLDITKGDPNYNYYRWIQEQDVNEALKKMDNVGRFGRTICLFIYEKVLEKEGGLGESKIYLTRIYGERNCHTSEEKTI